VAKAGHQNGGSAGAGEDDQPGIPDKQYFKIGEVCEITGVKQHVLRYWESEFKILNPQRARSKQRLYRRVDVENVLKIKKLLKGQGFTISGARKALVKEKGEPGSEVSADDLFRDIKHELLDLKKILEE
jgi:DNA-binding transcriptional MerR regulator